MSKDKNLKDLKVNELKRELQERGLSVSGNKSDLVSRLEEYLLRHEDERLLIHDCSCLCENRAFLAEIERMKLDISIVESRLPNAISQRESAIETLRRKQKVVKTVIQQQDTICKLIEENKSFKTKLMTIENFILKSAINCQENNVNEGSPLPHLLNSINGTSPSINDQLVNANPDLKKVNTSSSNNEISPIVEVVPTNANHGQTKSYRKI